MNAVTDIEKMALAGAPASEVGALALVTMDPAKYVAEVYKPFRAKLAELVEASEAAKLSKPDLRTGAGMDVAIKHRAGFRDDIRIGAEKTRVERKAPLLAIGKLLDFDYKEVAAAALPHETYWDAEIKAEEGRKENERAAKIAAERARVDAITDRIAALREDETDAVRKDKTAEQTRATLEYSLARQVTPELFEERFDEAVAAHAEVVASIRAVLVQRETDEAAAAKAEADKQAELKAMAEQKAEQARVAAAQAAKEKELADAAAELQRKRDEDAATTRAAQLEVERLAKVEADKVAAANAAAAKAIADAAADLAAKQAAFQKQQDNATAAAALYAEMDKHYDAALAEDAARTAARITEKQAMVDEAVAAGHDQAAAEHAAGLPAGALGADAMADLSITDEPSDEEIITMVAAAFDLSILGAVNRLAAIDFDAARTLAEAA